ncbi:MAG: PH domain-containing protein [Candidatus Bilamarchaeum sp.]|jgi:uncharacterized membrane protein YdbT with pleckstrin-like domain
MQQSYHPYNIIKILKVALLAIALSAILIYLREPLGNMFYYLLGVVLSISVFYILLVHFLSNFTVITLGENSLVYSTGVLSKREFVLTYSKISESGFVQTFSQRIFGVGTLTIDTPGGIENVVNVRDIRAKDAQVILSSINPNYKKKN